MKSPSSEHIRTIAERNVAGLVRRVYRHSDLLRLFAPRSIAIVGATPNDIAFGSRTLANLKGFSGRIHLVNAKYSRIGERVCHPSLLALPETPDCVLIATPQPTVEATVRECIAVKAGAAVIYASGYAETACAERIADQQALTALAREDDLRILGPNCMGFANYAQQTIVSFSSIPRPNGPQPAHAIGLACQSGALAFALAQALEHGTALSHAFSSGNACDVDVADQVAFLAEDPACSVVACLFEGIAMPARMIEAARLCADTGKPLVVYKMARGTLAAAAAMSHTGSMVGSGEAWAAAFDRAGAVQVDTLEQLMPTAAFFAKVSRPRSRGVAVLASSGGAAIIATDEAERFAIAMPQPTEPTQRVLEQHIPDFGSARNPCDVTAQVISNPQSLRACGEALFNDDQYGAVIVPIVTASSSALPRIEAFNQLALHFNKPACMIWATEALEGIGAREAEMSPGIALFRSASDCFAALAAWHRRQDWLDQQEAGAPTRLASAQAAAAARTSLSSMAERVLTERQAKQVLAHYGIPTTQERLVYDIEAALAAAQTIGYPVVLKVESPDIAHKTEAGVVRLGLQSPDAMRRAYADILENARQAVPGARIGGVLVQQQVPSGVECMVGARLDPQLGPLLVLGLGGVLVELLKDTCTALAPLSKADARQLLERLRGADLLRGFRGTSPVNLDLLAEVVARLSEFAADQADLLEEFDVNPLICAGDRVVAVDALMVRRLTIPQCHADT